LSIVTEDVSSDVLEMLQSAEKAVLVAVSKDQNAYSSNKVDNNRPFIYKVQQGNESFVERNKLDLTLIKRTPSVDFYSWKRW